MSGVSLWAYPWDLHDLGLEATCTRLAEVGVDMVSVATSYHAGRFLQPGNPRRRVYFPQDGTIYFRLDPSRWAGAEIVPLEADIVAAEGDMLADLVARRDAGGPGVSCWTVCLHNTRLGMMHPDHVLRTAQGDAQVFGLCPSSPAARAYVVGLVEEIATRYRPDRIEIESPDFMGFSHGFHHEKDGLPVLPEDDFLLSLCFCRHCLARAKAAGVEAEAAQALVAGLLDDAFARELPQAQFPDFPARGLDAFARLPALMAYLRWRSEPVTSLLAEVREVVPQGVQLLLIDYEGSWWGGGGGGGGPCRWPALLRLYDPAGADRGLAGGCAAGARAGQDADRRVSTVPPQREGPRGPCRACGRCTPAGGWFRLLQPWPCAAQTAGLDQDGVERGMRAALAAGLAMGMRAGRRKPGLPQRKPSLPSA